MGEHKNLIIAAAVAIVFTGFLVLYVVKLKVPESSSLAPPPGSSVPQAPKEDESLGAKVYEQAKNPVQQKIPETDVGGSVNPIEGLYTNPF